MRARLALQVVLIVAALGGSRQAFACDSCPSHYAVCFMHCPREAFTKENRAEGMRQLDEYLAKSRSLPPEVRAALPPEMQNVIAAAQRVKSASTENPLPPDELQRAANRPVETGGALDEAGTIDFLTRNALRNSNGTTVRAGADQAWNDLISGRAAKRTVSVGRDDDGAVVVQRTPPPVPKRDPAPSQGIALPAPPSGSAAKSAPAPIPVEAEKRAGASLEAARTRAAEDGGVVIHRTKYSALGAEPPPPPPTSGEAEKSRSFYQQCTEEFMKRLHP